MIKAFMTGATTFTLIFAASSAQALTVLGENFDDVISLGNVSNSGTPNVCINSPCTTISAGLPTGTFGNSNTGPAPTGANTAPDNSNVRRGDNTINTSTGTNGFASFFAATNVNGFLVLGDDSNTIGDGSPNNGLSFTRLPFAISSGFSSATVAFSWAFNGVDNDAAAADTFTARIVDASGTVLSTLLTRTSGTVAGYGNGAFSGTWGPGSSFSPGSYFVEFLTQEQTANNNTQSAAGIDNVLVTAVPEPSTYALLGVGCAMVGMSLRRSRRR